MLGPGSRFIVGIPPWAGLLKRLGGFCIAENIARVVPKGSRMTKFTEHLPRPSHGLLLLVTLTLSAATLVSCSSTHASGVPSLPIGPAPLVAPSVSPLADLQRLENLAASSPLAQAPIVGARVPAGYGVPVPDSLRASVLQTAGQRSILDTRSSDKLVLVAAPAGAATSSTQRKALDLSGNCIYLTDIRTVSGYDANGDYSEYSFIAWSVAIYCASDGGDVGGGANAVDCTDPANASDPTCASEVAVVAGPAKPGDTCNDPSAIGTPVKADDPGQVTNANKISNITTIFGQAYGATLPVGWVYSTVADGNYFQPNVNFSVTGGSAIIQGGGSTFAPPIVPIATPLNANSVASALNTALKIAGAIAGITTNPATAITASQIGKVGTALCFTQAWDGKSTN